MMGKSNHEKQEIVRQRQREIEAEAGDGVGAGAGAGADRQTDRQTDRGGGGLRERIFRSSFWNTQ